ncbi:MAG: response regulator, partial [Desulfofustis sp.]|nr:response regulator [Desulfofustis sp.]
VVFTALMMALAVGLFLTGTHLAARRLQRSITEPVSRLAATARRIAELGDYSMRAERAGRDEIGGLIDHFNSMLDAIQVRDSELHQHRHNLELIVGERTEELRRRRDEALAASQAKTEFLANMSHEIRTPMNGVIGVLSLLNDAPLSGEYRRLLETAGHSADALMHIINDILDFSKIDAGMVEFESIPFNVCELVEEVASLYVDAVSSAAIDLLCYVPPEVSCIVEGDPTRLRQILTNLVSNALKFTAKGQVFLRVERIELVERKQLLRFVVSDTGIGVPDNLMPRLFEKFTQADGSITRHFGGTGLGLSVCKQLVELQGGDIGVNSREGEGAEFWFSLQFKTAGESFRYGSSRDLGGLRVLIVDDNRNSLMILESYLTSVGAHVTCCSSGQDALARFFQDAVGAFVPDAILIDHQLADIDSAQLAGIIQKHYQKKTPHLVAIASGTLGMDQARQSGFQAIVYQPIRRGQLLDVIAACGSFTRVVEAGRHDGRSARTRLTGTVLLVDDEPINQKVAQAILERFGLEVRTASHGKEAIDLAREADFDVILMDIQMPEMSGYEATELIRIREREGRRKRSRIIAMTANALKSTKMRCLESGMDDFISKPIKPEMLAERLRPWLPGGSKECESRSGEADDPSADDRDQIWDRQQALQLAGGDEALLTELIVLFLQRRELLLARIAEAIERGDATLLDDAAHAFKGAVNHFCAGRVSRHALALEVKGKHADLDGTVEIFQELKTESGRLTRYLVQQAESTSARFEPRPS